jgi:uncharacterized membrane protein YphA (DoxX/SURF4 family)
MNSLKNSLKRFIVIYFLIYIFPFPLDYLPFVGTYVSNTVESFWNWVVPIVYEQVLGFDDQLVLRTTGSGDRTVDYVLLLIKFLLALVFTLVDVIIQIGRKRNDRHFDYFIMVMRYFLAFNMFGYGLSKVFYLQFSQLSLYSLEQTFGNSSPMGLLWRFMGYSEPYTVFTGILEVLGGLLLIWRKTKIIGAIICFGVMLNVFVLNLSYDVPVKLFSLHLTIICLVILMPDFKNIVGFFFKNQPTTPIANKPYFTNRKKEVLRITIKIFLVSIVLFSGINTKLKQRKQYGKRVPEHSLYGVYEVRLLTLNNDTLLLKDSNFFQGRLNSWKSMLIDKRDSRVVQIDGESKAMKHELDTVNKIFTLTPYLNDDLTYKFKYEQLDNELRLIGDVAGDSLSMKLFKKNRKDFYLEGRGFHWINDYPMNR